MNLIELLDESRRRAASLAAQSASSSTAVPDLIGRAVESQMLTGLSPAAATQDPGGFQRLYQEQRNAGALMTGPLTTDWMNEAPENAALVQDEVPRIVNWELTAERLVRDATGAGNLEAAARSWWLGMRSISPSVQLANQQPRLEDAIDYLGTLRALEDQIAEGRIPNYEMLATSNGRSTNASILQLQRYAAAGPDERAAERARVAQQIAGYEDSIGYVRDVLRDYSDSQGLLAAGRTINASDVRDLRSLGEYVTITGTQGVLDLVTYAGLGVLGSAVGGPVGGATTVLTYGSLRGFSGITAEQAIQDAPYTTEEIARAQLFGSLMGLTEVALGPTARYLRGAAGRALTREAYSEVTQEVLDRVSQGYLRRVGREAGASAVEEFFQEGAQYFLQKAGVEGVEFRWTDTTLLEAFNAAMAGVVGGGIIGGAFGARQQIVLERMSRELRDAGKTVQNMEELANVTQDLQLAQRSPTKFQQLAQRLGLNRVPVFYQADDLNTYFQSQNKDPITEVVKLGATAEDFEAALASGGRVAVTAEGLARAGLRGTDGDFLRDSGSFTPAGATPAEARTVEQTYNEIQQQLQEQSRMAEMAPQRRQVYDAIYGQLRAAGRPQREAEANAALSTAFFETMAARYGEDSGLDLYRRFGFRVEGPRQMARAEAAAEAAQMQIPDDVVNTITDAISQAQTGAPVTIPVTPEVTLALQTLGVPIDPTGTISADDAQRLTDALQSLEDVAAPLVAGPTLEQAAASVGMRTPEFQQWFADSKVVDDAGQPLVVYHHGSFDEQVDVPAGPMHFGTAQAARERAFGKAIDDAAMRVEAYQSENGIWHWDDGSGMTSEDMGAAGFSDEETAIAYGRSEVIRQMENDGLDVEADDLGATTAVYLNIRNPKRVADAGGAEGEWDAVIEQAIAEGHDGIVYRNQFEDKGSDSYIAFSPTQIKSVNNQGTFDPNDPRILFQGPVGDSTPAQDDLIQSDVDAGASMEAQQADVIARVEAAGGEVLSFDHLDNLVSDDLVPVLTPDDLVGMNIFPTIADRTAAAVLYRGIEGAELDIAVPLLGGPLFPLRMSNWANDVVWANRGAAVKGAKENKLAEGATHMMILMGDQDMHISNTTVSYAYLQTFFAKMASDNPPDAAAITQYLQSWQADAAPSSAKTEAVRKQVREFPGFDDKRALLDYTHRISFEARKKLMQLFATKEIEGLGGPPVQRILDETREQSLTGLNWGDGVLVVELDRGAGGGSFVDLGTEGTTPHPDFPLGMRGKVVGRLDTPLNWRTLWSSWLMKNEGKSNPRRAFELARPSVEVTPQLSAQLADAASPGVQTPLHARIVAALMADEMRRSGVAKNKGGIGPQDYLNEAATAGVTPIRADAKALNAAIKAGDVQLARIGDERVFYGAERVDGALRLTSLINNERGTEGLGETVAILDAMRNGVTEAVADADSLVYDLLQDLGFTTTDTPGLLRLEGGPNERAVDDYFGRGLAGLLDGRARSDGAEFEAAFGSARGEGAEDQSAARRVADAGAAAPDGADPLSSRARRIAQVLADLSDTALDNLGLTARDRANAAALTAGGPAPLEQQTLEQRPEGEGPRGSITFPAGGLDSEQSVIRLFERADRSTFAHEAGHFFLEAFKQLATDPQAPQGMLDDFRTINEYLGRDPGDASAYTVEQQETWARSFEAYVMEGKAPSIALRSAFERFKAWLTRIYRQAVNLQVELSPEIRDVMDRMLATEEEIALVKAEQEIAPLFLERPAGMDADDYDRYRRTATEADDDASQRLMNRLMARIRLQRQKTYNAERKALAETVSEELRKTRTYQTVDRLQTGETRLSRQQIVDQFGEDALRDLSRESLGGKFAIYAKGGKDLSVMAELMGYESAVEMIDDLRTAQKFSVAVELEVKKRLDQKYGDLLTDGSIKDAARAAMHSDKRGQLLTAEANQLRKEVEQAGGPTPPVLSREAIKQQARNMIQDLTVRQAANPNAFLRAERKAAGEAQRAFSRVARAPSGRLATTGAQDLIAAHAAKRRQLLNHYLYIESRKAEELVAKMRKQATRLQKKSTREAVASPYIDQVFALLEQYDFRQLSPGQVARQESLAAFVETMRLAGREGELAIDERLIERAERTHFSTLTVDELQGLKDTLDNLEHLGRTKMKLLDAKRERNFAQVQKSVLQALDRNLPDQPQALVPRAADARRRAGQIALNTVLSADAIINRLDGSVQGVGDVWRALKEPINNGLARVQVRKQQAATDFADLFKQFYSDKERRDLNSKMLSVPEVGQSLPKQAILAIALNTGNRDNFERLTNPETPHSIPKDRVESILSTHLDERDWRFVQAVWDYIDGYWPEIAAQERALTGVNPKKVDARPYVTPYGFVKGGYFPIRYDPRLSGAVQDYDHNQMMENLKGGRFAKAQTRNGHTKERGASTGQPLRLDLGIAIAHVNDVIYDLEMRQPVQNTWRLLSDPQIDAAFKRKNASEDAEALKLWVQDVANGDRWSGSGWSAAYRHLRGGLSIAKMGFSITTLVQQPTGLLQSAVVVGKGPLAKALWKYKNNPLRNAAAVRAMSPFMEERQQTFQRDLAVLTEGMAEDPTFSRYNTFKQVMSAAAFYLIQKSQYYIVDVPTWMAAYDTELRKNGGDANAAARVADQIVARAQGSGLLSDRTAFERGTLGKDTRNVELARLMTTFGSYMMAKFSVATQRVRGTDLKNPAEFVHLLVDLLLLYTIESALAVYLTGNWPDFEDEDEDPLALFLAKETGLAVMSGLPIAREAASTLEGFGGGGTLAAAIEESAGLATGAYRMGEIAAGLEDPDRAKAAVKDVVGGMGVLFQLPTIQLERTLDGMFDNDMQFREDFTAMDLLLGQRPD